MVRNILVMTDAEALGKLAKALDADLAPARKHLVRLCNGDYADLSDAMLQMIYGEIEQSVQACIEHLRRDLTLPNAMEKKPRADAMGRSGGLARARNLSAERRKEIATKAAQARWTST